MRPRSFDHDQAYVMRHHQHLSYREIANQFGGVTPDGVRLAIRNHPGVPDEMIRAARNAAEQARWQAFRESVWPGYHA